MPLLRVLKSRSTLNQTRTLWHIEHMAWLINAHGPIHLPRVPSVLQRFESLSQTAYRSDDARTQEDWAEDLFGRVVTDCHMQDWDLKCRELPDDPDKGIAGVSVARTWHPKAPGLYYVDVLGNPVVVSDPDNASCEGGMALSYILQLATLRLISSNAPEHYDPYQHAMAVMGVAVYNGQGLECLAMASRLTQHLLSSGRVKQSEINAFIGELEFATVLAMKARGLAPEQVVASYGPILERSLRKRIWSIYQELEAFAPEVKLLQRLCSGFHDSENNQAQLRSAVS